MKKKVFCAVSLQFRVNHTCIHTHRYTHACLHTPKTETTPFYTVNNAMYPWHNQKDSAKAIARSVFIWISMHISLVYGIRTTYKTRCTLYLDLREPSHSTNLITWYRDVERGFWVSFFFAWHLSPKSVKQWNIPKVWLSVSLSSLQILISWIGKLRVVPVAGDSQKTPGQPCLLQASHQGFPQCINLNAAL